VSVPDMEQGGKESVTFGSWRSAGVSPPVHPMHRPPRLTVRPPNSNSGAA